MGATTAILGNDRRMLMIEYLQKMEGNAELRELVEYIAEREGGTPTGSTGRAYTSV